MTAEQEQARQAAWLEYRPLLARRQAEFRRKAEEEGRGHLAFEPLPVTAPSWFRRDDGLAHGHETATMADADPTTIRLPAGVDPLGRPVAAPRGLTADEQFKQAERGRLRRFLEKAS